MQRFSLFKSHKTKKINLKRKIFLVKMFAHQIFSTQTTAHITAISHFHSENQWTNNFDNPKS